MAIYSQFEDSKIANASVAQFLLKHEQLLLEDRIEMMGYQVSEYLGENYEPLIEKVVEFNTIGVLSERQIITNI